MFYSYDKDEIKNNLTIEQIRDIVAELGGEPQLLNNTLLCKTICHGGDSHKLYYYDNTKLFRCYTGCAEPTFDVFELVRKVKSREHNIDHPLPYAVDYVARYFGISPQASQEEIDKFKNNIQYWDVLKEYDRINQINPTTQEVELKEYDGSFLANMPRPIVTSWVKDGISIESMNRHEICFDPVGCGVIIPHRDINNKLIGIRTRSLIKEDQERFGKYRPAYLNGKLYNHPLGFNLYNLNLAKDVIKTNKRVIVAEGEKSCLQYGTMFGEDNNICVACCGSSFISYQAWLLINLGVEEIIIGFDKQYQSFGDMEHIKLVKNLTNIFKKYGHYVKISYLFDKENLLGYKDSPFDRGKDVFMELYKRRVDLYK